MSLKSEEVLPMANKRESSKYCQFKFLLPWNYAEDNHKYIYDTGVVFYQGYLEENIFLHICTLLASLRQGTTEKIDCI